jgi:hypothetical protein
MRTKEKAFRDSDENKPDFIDAISWTALDRFVQYMESKKKRFGVGNFKKGMPIERYERALIRHFKKYVKNKYEKGNDEKDQDHLSAIIFNGLGIIHEEEMLKIKTKTKK